MKQEDLFARARNGDRDALNHLRLRREFVSIVGELAAAGAITGGGRQAIEHLYTREEHWAERQLRNGLTVLHALMTGYGRTLKKSVHYSRPRGEWIAVDLERILETLEGDHPELRGVNPRTLARDLWNLTPKVVVQPSWKVRIGSRECRALLLDWKALEKWQAEGYPRRLLGRPTFYGRGTSCTEQDQHVAVDWFEDLAGLRETADHQEIDAEEK